MASIRLTDSIRDRIAIDLLKGKFDDQRDAMIPKWKAFSAKCYDRAYSAKEQATMSDLPKGWLPEAGHMSINFGPSFSYIYFNGGNGNVRLKGMECAKLKEESKRFSYEMYRSSITLKRDDPLTKEFDALKKEQQHIIDAHEKLNDEIYRVLNSVSTTGALVKVWPEIEPIVRKACPLSTPGMNPPAPILSGLNERLGLKLPKKAA